MKPTLNDGKAIAAAKAVFLKFWFINIPYAWGAGRWREDKFKECEC